MAEYIDREALIAELAKGVIITDDCYGMGIMAGLDRALKVAREATADDVVKVKHGRWIISQKYEEIIEMEVVKYTCSVCNEYRLSATGLSQATNYCPACGARMDGADVKNT